MKWKVLLNSLVAGTCFSFSNCKKVVKNQTVNQRSPEYPVDEIFIKRWSGRAMSGEPITQEELMSLFEAAKWAPSSYNNQPWRFIYAQKGSAHWDRFLKFLVPFNQTWASQAAVLIVVISSKFFDHNGKPSKTHSFDAGLACQNLLLQASINGLVGHAMEGFNYDDVQKELLIPESYAVEAMVAIGKPGDVKKLPEELHTREIPSQRKNLDTIVFENIFIKTNK